MLTELNVQTDYKNYVARTYHRAGTLFFVQLVFYCFIDMFFLNNPSASSMSLMIDIDYEAKRVHNSVTF